MAKLQADAKSLERLIEELRLAVAGARAGRRAGSIRCNGPWSVAVAGERGIDGEVRSIACGWSVEVGWLDDVLLLKARKVPCAAAGRVLYSDWLPGLGLLLVLDHGNGIMSLYGHNEQLYKKQGENVTAGDLLAAVGDSGLGGRSGLYLDNSQRQTGCRSVELAWETLID